MKEKSRAALSCGLNGLMNQLVLMQPLLTFDLEGLDYSWNVSLSHLALYVSILKETYG